MTNTEHQGLTASYVREVRALKSACVGIISGCTRIVQECEQAETEGRVINISNYETTLSSGYRILLKTLGVILHMQTLGAKFRGGKR